MSYHHTNASSYVSVPSWLETPPSARVEPPTVTRIQELPFGNLTWEDFEKLCLRLVRLEANVEYCRLYGTQGQAQRGIDIFARQKTLQKYRVYQCKLVNQFGPAKIRTAISKFLEGDWASKTEVFTLCTKESLRSTKRADAFEVQRDLLRMKGITLVSWDSNELSTKLKDYANLVDDFFGRSWVATFCGEEEARNLGNRLDRDDITEFRNKLLAFYKTTFNTHDPGLPIATLGEAHVLPLEERYVLPDINDWSPLIISQSDEQNKVEFDENLLKNSPFGTTTSNASQQVVKSHHATKSIRQRQPVDKWLARASRNIILGGPGSGKSSLLRFIAIDLLRESPRFDLLAQQWGQFLPVWVPFALWTKMIATPTTTTRSLSELLYGWLKSLDEEKLWPLIQKALDDERLLLLVDGVDEWTNEDAAKIALDRLTVFIEQRGIPAIVTSRPHGFERLGMREMGWQLGELSDFSPEQQKQLSRIWFTYWVMSQSSRELTLTDDDVQRKADSETERFLDELNKSIDLGELAKIPLLLCLLIYHRFYYAQLPQSRFKAYDSLIENLISIHPHRRKTTAFITDEPSDITDDEVKRILARLAFHIQENFREGLLDHAEAVAFVEDCLTDSNWGFGFQQRDAHRYSEKILDMSKNTLGILVSRSPSEIAFYHRSFQEYLAAYHLTRMPLDEQLALVDNQCIDPQWREVLLGLIFLTNRPEDIKRFVDRLKKKSEKADFIGRNSINLLLCETAFSDFNCSVSLAREIAQEAFEQLHLGFWMPQRERLLHHILDGLRSIKVKELVKSKLKGWFPERIPWRERIFSAMAQWPSTPETIDCLWKGIHDEHTGNQRAAAKALATLAAGHSEVGDRVASLAHNALNPRIRFAAIEALLHGWPDHSRIIYILDNARKSASPELRLIAITGMIQAKNHSEDDYEELIRLGRWRDGIDYHWHNDVASSLITGWPNATKIKEICFRSLESKFQNDDQLENEIALRILLEGFPQDNEVAEYCANQIRTEKSPFLPLRLNAWTLLTKNFRDHPILVGAIDEWLPKKEAFYEPDIAMAALVGRTLVAKKKLLSTLGSRVPHWAAGSLLEGWGMSDDEVAQELKSIGYGPINRASWIGDLIPKIIGEKAEAGSRLLELLKSPECARHDFVLSGLQSLGDTFDDTEVVDAFQKIPIERRSIINDMGIGQLIVGYSSDPRVRKLSLQELSRQNGNYTAVAFAYGNDEEIRSQIIDIACPLPTHLRAIIAERLGSRDVESAYTLSALKQYDLEQDDGVKTQASISYHRRLKTSGQDLEPAIQKLSEDIECYGHDYEERRRAAFVGLLELKRLDIMENAKETIGRSEPCAISLRDWHSPNLPLIRHTLEHWDYLKETFHEDIWSRLSDRHSDQAAVWDSLCLLANEYPAVSEELIRSLESNGSTAFSSQILKFISRIRPESHFLLDCCLKTLGIDKGSTHPTRQDQHVAAELIGMNFNEDQEVLSHILSLRPLQPGYPDETLILVLSEGWPGCTELNEIYNIVKANRLPLGYREYFQIICLKSESNIIFKALTDMISYPPKNPEWAMQPTYRPIMRRLRTDDELLSLIMTRLKGKPSPSEKATLSRLAGSARGVSPELQKWCIDEIESQLNQENPPETGIDIVSGEIRPVADSLLDVVGHKKIIL